MALVLPTEIWAKILPYLPHNSLHIAKYVNHSFNQICGDILLRKLDLTMTFSEYTVLEQLEFLRKQLSLAKSRPLAVKTLRFMPSVFIPFPYQPSGENRSGSWLFQILERIFKRKHEKPNQNPLWEECWRPEPPRSLVKAIEFDMSLSSLLPSLTSLEQLYIDNPNRSYGGWASNADIALKVASSRLTMLSIQFSAVDGSSIFPHMDSANPLVLPALQVFRLHANIDGPSPFAHLEVNVRHFISRSPLLGEIEYHPVCSDFQFVLNTMRSSVHPLLKVFKWTATEAVPLVYAPSTTPIAVPFTPLLTSHSRQLEILHLNPVPSLEGFRRLNTAQLIELRINLSCCDDRIQFFSLLVDAGQLVTLEVIGFEYSPQTIADSANLIPEVVLNRLKRLYLGIAFDSFSPRTLKTLASKALNLHTLSLIVATRPDKFWTRKEIQTICESFVVKFQLLIIHADLLDCKIWDFGIVVPEWKRVGILDFESVLNAISQRVPSIESFYGTGSLHLWERMEKNMDETWGGELWMEKSKWW
ncbi:hypothetical protein DL96DRAFT_1620580 [Flagelloscypha sp. PMI_526]|nr:hypothetical protein DL96DRAFT_1620580 [Flagelloscypha sp. PMI_526]